MSETQWDFTKLGKNYMGQVELGKNPVKPDEIK